MRQPDNGGSGGPDWLVLVSGQDSVRVLSETPGVKGGALLLRWFKPAAQGTDPMAGSATKKPVTAVTGPGTGELDDLLCRLRLD